jgi:anti-sigma B factor antagonist
MNELARVRVRERGGIVLAVVEGEIDVSNVQTLSGQIAAGVENSALALLIDLTAVEFMDSTGVHMLYDLEQRLATRQQRFAVVIPSGRPPRRAIELSGSDPGDWLFEDQAAALVALDRV